MRICVFGAGVIGGIIASAHARAGHEVALIARGAHLDAIKARGLTVVAPGDDSVTTRHAASSDPRDFGPQDLVIVSTKTPAFADVAAHIAPLLGPETLVGFAVNGIFWFYGDGFQPGGMRIDVSRLDPQGALHREIGARRALGYVCNCGGEIHEPGTIHANHARGQGRIVVGAALPAVAPQAKAMIDALGVTDLDLRGAVDIRAPMWRKYLGIVANFAGCSLTGGSIAQTQGNPEAREVLLRLTAEAVAVAAAHGFDDLGFDIEKARKSPPGTSPHKPSMLQDLERGRPMEIDSSYLALQDLARAAGVATPTVDTIVPLLVLRARLAGCY
jgi:2-dehydropantoate 2-reductase